MKTEPMTSTEQKRFSIHTFTQKLGPFLGLLILVLIVSVLNPSFLEPLNILNLLRQVAINALIAFGMTFVILTGGIDLSVGAILALSSALVAGMMVSGIDPILAVIIGCVIGAVLGMIKKRIINHKRKNGAVHRHFGDNDRLSRTDPRLYGRKSDYGTRFKLRISIIRARLFSRHSRTCHYDADCICGPVGSSAQNTVRPPDIRHRRQ